MVEALAPVGLDGKMLHGRDDRRYGIRIV